MEKRHQMIWNNIFERIGGESLLLCPLLLKFVGTFGNLGYIKYSESSLI